MELDLIELGKYFRMLSNKLDRERIHNLQLYYYRVAQDPEQRA